MAILNNNYLTEELFSDPEQIKSTRTLYETLQLASIPYTPDWSASPDFLELILNHTLLNKPDNIVECSSGTSSLVLAKCCELNKNGKVTSLEHEARYARQTESYLSHYDLDEYATVIHAPLIQTDTAEGMFQWYDSENIPTSTIDMLVIDGPPGFIQKNSRYPALELLYERLATNSTVFIDDANRPDEKKIIELWLKKYSGIQHEFKQLDRGCSILHISKTKII